MLAAMAAMFVAALAVPDAFGRQGGVFGIAFLIVNIMFLALFALTTRNETELLAAILRIVPVFLTGATLITVAGFVHGMLRPTLWLIALVYRHVRTALAWNDRLAPAARTLHRASRTDRDHRNRRVIDRHWHRREEHRT